MNYNLHALSKKTERYLQIEGGFVRLTNEGLFLYNKICEEFAAAVREESGGKN